MTPVYSHALYLTQGSINREEEDLDTEKEKLRTWLGDRLRSHLKRTDTKMFNNEETEAEIPHHFITHNFHKLGESGQTVLGK